MQIRDLGRELRDMEAKRITSSSSFHVLTLVLAFLLCASNVQKSIADSTTTGTSSSTTYTSYLKTACNCTIYPKLCYESLSSYTPTIKTNDLQLCNTALTVTIEAASNTSSLVKYLSTRKGLTKIEAGIINDCIEEVGDSINRLKQSLNALGSLNGTTTSDVEFQISNVKTWVSAALTDENTCTDGFVGRTVSDAVKITVRNSIVKVARLTSNALALINRLSY